MSDVSPVPSAGVNSIAGLDPVMRSIAPKFQALLDRLQRLTSEQPRAEDLDTPETLQRALQTADDGLKIQNLDQQNSTFFQVSKNDLFITYDHFLTLR